MKLIYVSSGREVQVGDKVTVRAGDATITSIEKPHKPSSTGKVYVRPYGSSFSQGYYPSVIDAQWIEREDQTPNKAAQQAEAQAKPSEVG